MTAAAFALVAGYLGLAFGRQSVLQRRRTGSAGFRGVSGPPGSAEWLGGVLFIGALVTGLATPALAWAGLAAPLAALSATAAGAAGAVLALGGIALSLAAQRAMGAAWRIGVDAAERTDLVTAGPFEYVRNPFFTAALGVGAGVALMVPSVPALIAVGALLVAVELQVRRVEEPYLVRAQGERYRAYAAATGRFVPGVGRLA